MEHGAPAHIIIFFATTMAICCSVKEQITVSPFRAVTSALSFITS